MPKWGLSMKEGSILKWIKSNGDDISKGDMILEIVCIVKEDFKSQNNTSCFQRLSSLIILAKGKIY